MSNYYCHPKAIVESTNIGKNTHIWAFTHVMNNVAIGKNCNIGNHCFIETGAYIGEGVTIKNSVNIWEGVVLSDFVFVGPNVVFTNDLYPRSPRLEHVKYRYKTKKWLTKTIINLGVSLGANSTIIAGVEIGEFALIGAGSVVVKNVDPYTLVIGNPASFCNYVCRCSHKIFFNDDTTVCDACGSHYQIKKERVFLSEK